MSLGEETVYSVVVFEYPPGKGPSPDNDTYVKLVNAYAKGSDSRLRKRGTATIAGYPGFEAISDDKKGKLSHLIAVIPSGDRIYMLVTAGPKAHATSDGATRFRDSFRLLARGEPRSRAVGRHAPARSSASRAQVRRLRLAQGPDEALNVTRRCRREQAHADHRHEKADRHGEEAAKSLLMPPQLAAPRAASSQRAEGCGARRCVAKVKACRSSL